MARTPRSKGLATKFPPPSGLTVETGRWQSESENVPNASSLNIDAKFIQLTLFKVNKLLRDNRRDSTHLHTLREIGILDTRTPLRSQLNGQSKRTGVKATNLRFKDLRQNREANLLRVDPVSGYFLDSEEE